MAARTDFGKVESLTGMTAMDKEVCAKRINKKRLDDLIHVDVANTGLPKGPVKGPAKGVFRSSS